MEKLIIPSILTVSDVINLADHVLKITLPCNGLDAKFSSLYNKNKQFFDRLVKNQKSSLKSEFTEDLIRGDKNRDLAFICIRDVIGGISLCLIPELAQKASKLNGIIEKIGKNLFRLSYKTESALLLTLFVEFDKPENQQLLNDLEIRHYYQSLKEAQSAFDFLSSQKSEEKTLQGNDSEAATLILGEMIPAFTGLVGMLQLYAELEPEVYGEIYAQVVTRITETNTVARARKTRKQNQKEEVKPA